MQHPSPKHTLRVRKTKRAPLPPSSTPFEARKPPNPTDNIDISPVVIRSIQEEPISGIPEAAQWENEKLAKDEMNRNKQTQQSTQPISKRHTA